ncbi:hypothetical protein B0O99DRAFT_354591 [Bisporella sp. PMI_857]|nr:hypothetical protein B0O99DRAFT_354591 [Bisporella sp. PMI_857]
MYRWYQKATVCYVYLFDCQSIGDSFAKSTWWSRGWTLQELIAPSNVVFYNYQWVELGKKTTLLNRISSISNIDIDMLTGASPQNFSIAKRMSWASTRTTTRVEDAAYCLLGLFGVNMPMLYGEGERAFIRLQEEVMKHSDDHSLFAWSSQSTCHRGLLAKSPADFKMCGNIVLANTRLNRSPYSVTNMGLSIELPMVGWGMETYFAALDCGVEGEPDSRIGIFLKLFSRQQTDHCVRVMLGGKDRDYFKMNLVSKSHFRKVYVRQSAWDTLPQMDRLYGYWLRTTVWGDGHVLSQIDARNEWDNMKRLLVLPIGTCGTAGVLWWDDGFAYSCLKLGFDENFNPVCQLKGQMWGSTRRLCYPEMRDEKTGKALNMDAALDDGWIVSHEHSWFYKGDRVSGMAEHDELHRIFMNTEVINGVKVWVVDVVQHMNKAVGNIEERSLQILCNGCDKEITGKRFKCLVCANFDYCLECELACAETHPHHKFEEILPWEAYICDGCGKNIDGRRYQCPHCPTFMYCEACKLYASKHTTHDADHQSFHALLRDQRKVLVPVPFNAAQDTN